MRRGNGLAAMAATLGLTTALLSMGAGKTLADQVILDDLIVDGSLCVGFDCVNNENFGFDTIRLKENNLRIKFEDTSTGSFPSNDWQLTANDSASGGQNKFSIDDVTGAKVPFTVEAGAPTNSFYLDSTGRVGLRTANPVLDLHIQTTNTPGIRLDQTNAGGFSPQVWDVAGNEANFFVRDVTSGSRLSLRIRPGAPTSSLDIAADGDVGMGTASPAAALHVLRSTGTAEVRVEETNATQTLRTLLTLSNRGNPAIRMTNIGNSNTWQMQAGATYIISHSSSFNTDLFRLFSDGNLTIAGTLTENSDRNAKMDIARVDDDAILEKVAQLDISEWSYKSEPSVRHIGPMAQDFHALFKTGASETKIATIDTSGVALASIKAMTRRLDEARDELDEARGYIAQLEGRLSALENSR